MKKFYSIIVAALLALISVSANAINIIVNIDDPSRVSVYTNYGSTLVDNIVAGDNNIIVNEYESVSIKAKDNAFLTKVVKSIDGTDDSEQNVSNMSECSLYISSGDEGAKFTVTTANADEVRDGFCRIWVDDPANVMVQRSGSYSYIDLQEGWNDVKYITASELPLSIGPKNYGTSLYQVKVNGSIEEPQGTAWRISPANGAEVEIFANFPDIDIPVKFSYVSDEAKGFITSVTVNNETVNNYNDDNFVVKAGSSMTVTGNTTDYKLNSFTVNGNSIYFYGQYTFTVTAETTIEVDAKKYGMVKATLDIDNPDNVIVYRGYSYNNDIITGLVAGENEIELSETNTLIQIKAVSGSYVSSVKAGEMAISKDYSDAYNITVTEGMKIVVKSGVVERNSKAVVYIDSKEAATQYFNFQRADRSTIDVVSGYNEISFYEGDNPFALSWYGAEYANVYKNNEAVEPMYSGSTTYELNLTDGDVVKIFLASNPEKLEAEIEASDNVDAAKVSVTMDRMTNVTDWVGKHEVLPGTEIKIKPEEDYIIYVAVDGKDITAGEDGTFTIVVNKNTAVVVRQTNGTGIGEIEQDKEAGNGVVYNLQGVRMAENADMSRLPAGIYIINGKKFVKQR